LGVNKTMNAIFSHERLLLLEKMVELSGFSAVRRSPRPRRGVIHAKARELSFRRVKQLIEFGTVDRDLTAAASRRPGPSRRPTPDVRDANGQALAYTKSQRQT
jgi:hypothetical protein